MDKQIQVADLLKKVRAKAPVVHNITNYVVMNWTANCLLSAGASPVMAHATEEVEAMVGLSQALVINLGTLSTKWIESMGIAMAAAANKNIPVVLDPVGSGATSFRTETAQYLIREFRPTVIRANASEILSLRENGSGTRGVDSRDSSDSAVTAASELSRDLNCVVCVSGEIDYVVSKDRVVKIANGHPIMTKVTGMGCAASALIGAFLGVHDDAFEATVAAMTVTGIAGEIAANLAQRPGSFQPRYLDALFAMDEESILKHQRIHS